MNGINVSLLQNLPVVGKYFESDTEQTTEFREAFGVTIDDDESEWRSLTGDSNRDLSPLTQRRMQEMAVYLWEANLVANRLIELPLAYMLAEGVSIEVDDEDARKWLNAFWKDPINCMDIKLEKKVRELALYGEQCWPTFVNDENGHVRLGYLDPSMIETVITDPDNKDQVIGIKTVHDKEMKNRFYRVNINGPESVFTERTQKLREGYADGNCFYFTINALSNGRRGRSDLLAQADWLDAYDQFLFGETDRVNFLRAFMWDVTMKGATPDQVEARAKEIKPPNPGSVRVHNDSEVWKAETPALNAADTSEIARVFRNHVLGGGTVPEHWFGGGGDVNRATGESMGEPTFKIFSMRQRTLKHILEEVAKFVINSRLEANNKDLIDPADPDPDLLPRVVFPEMTAKDTTKYAAALGQVVMACVAAINAGILSELTAVMIISTIAAALGIEFDADEELKKAKSAADDKLEDDVLEDPADVDEGDETNAE
ncbi:MAG: hypothetical protein FVQ79_00645 [Planctomycetes bacterium]|nr:hypothetical protein [Planctomycetota bacterium]